MSIGYEEDFYGWLNHNAELLRQGRFSELDIENLAEELEGMGRSERRVLSSRLEVLLAHLLKWQFQSSRRGNSWKYSIKEQRRKVDRHLRENPSLKHELDEIFSDAYDDAVLMAARETDMDEESFPPTSPWTFEQAMDADFLPQ